LTLRSAREEDPEGSAALSRGQILVAKEGTPAAGGRSTRAVADTEARLESPYRAEVREDRSLGPADPLPRGSGTLPGDLAAMRLFAEYLSTALLKVSLTLRGAA